jgi:hypothetical protein
MSSLRRTRRDFLRLGALGGISLPWLWYARAEANKPTAPGFGKARRCILLFLTGGPPQHDTFDPKPDAPAEIRGEFKPIATTMPSVRFAELCPRLARQANRLCVVRSVTHTDGTHTSAGYTMLTGATHPLPNNPDIKLIRPSPNDHPHPGSLLSMIRPARGRVPAFVSLPEIIKDDAINEFPGQGPGLLGNAHGPFRIDMDERRTGFRVPDLTLPAGMTLGRLDDRRTLLDRLDRSARKGSTLANAERDGLTRRAYDLLHSPAVHRAVELGRESERLRDAYGRHLFAQGCLLARRLIEANVSLVTVYWHYEGPADSPVWDTHQNNFAHCRNRLIPPTDQGVAMLLDDLARRGLLDETLVICLGEFGRTPKINKQAGRDHWPAVQSILLAGAGVRAGSVYGASDRNGAMVAEAPVSPADLMATILHLLGVDPGMEVQDRAGRLLRICEGKVVTGVLA